MDQASYPLHKKQLRSRKGHRLLRWQVFLALLLPLMLISSVFSVKAYKQYTAMYHRDMPLAEAGSQHLRTGLALLESLPKRDLDLALVRQASQEFKAASTSLVQVNNDLTTIPSGATLLPIYGTRLGAAQRILPLAIEAAQGGVVACSLLETLLPRIHNLLSAQGQGLSITDYASLAQQFRQITALFHQLIQQYDQLQPSDLQVDERLQHMSSMFHSYLPAVQTWFNAINTLLPVMPGLLGIGKPTSYLVELLDTTELRPGGGFIGNYGIITLAGGHVQVMNIQDTYLLDQPFANMHQHIPYPPAYKWFDLSPDSWSLRDANLDADFPTSARYSEQNYQRESGNRPVQGVIAITPAFIQQAIAITGPVAVPEYHETITAQNLIERIHYYQLGEGRTGNDVPSPDGRSSVRKHFTALLAEHFFDQLRHLSPTALPQLAQIGLHALQTKDIQMYLNTNIAEDLLRRYGLASAIETTNGDSLFVVDANISANKASAYLTYTMNDQVAIDPEGNAYHTTTLRYTWALYGALYGHGHYRDFIQVYLPPNSKLMAQNGWEARGNSIAPGHSIQAGFITLAYGETRTITLQWMSPGAAHKKGDGWSYQELIQRQAGVQWQVHVQVSLPGCARIIATQGLLKVQSKTSMSFSQFLDEDSRLGTNYDC